jgi:hypothetical protein
MITRALNLYYTIFLEDIRYMIILTRQERERPVLELDNMARLIERYLRWQEQLHGT